MKDADFPYDVQWTDIDVMSAHLDFTYDNISFHGLPELIHELKSEGKHYVNIIDPGISATQPNGTYPPYDDGLKRGIFIRKFNSTEPIIGQVKQISTLATNINYQIFLGLARCNSISRLYKS
jgi:alpha-glucosidase (family GH31 glycosyl hydrolase)